MSLILYQVDSFTDRPFAGNPAAVCLLQAPADESYMLDIAREMNLSETAFVTPGRTPGEPLGLRWFTPTTEVQLCGHATLATAHVLWDAGIIPSGKEVAFDTQSGRLVARQQNDGWIELDFPAYTVESREAPAGLAEALGVTARTVAYSHKFWIVEVADEQAVRDAAPDFAGIVNCGAGCAILTATASPGTAADIVCRVFVPAAGINEDPVTGSAQCALLPFWQGQLGTDRLICYQASARGGTLRSRLEGERIFLSGQAVTVMEARLRV